MAGDVKVGVWNGELVIQGDNNSTQVEVHEYAEYHYQVRGFNGTTINGGVAASFYNPTDKVHAYMRGGDDQLYFYNQNRTTSMASVFIDMGSGADIVSFLGTSVGFNTSTVVMGADWETMRTYLIWERMSGLVLVLLRQTFWGNLNIRTGGGNDQVNFRDSSYIYSNLDLRTESGHDQVRVDRLNVRDSLPIWVQVMIKSMSVV